MYLMQLIAHRCCLNSAGVLELWVGSSCQQCVLSGEQMNSETHSQISASGAESLHHGPYTLTAT